MLWGNKYTSCTEMITTEEIRQSLCPETISYLLTERNWIPTAIEKHKFQRNQAIKDEGKRLTFYKQYIRDYEP